jgi:hypothetical protein
MSFSPAKKWFPMPATITGGQSKRLFTRRGSSHPRPKESPPSHTLAVSAHTTSHWSQYDMTVNRHRGFSRIAPRLPRRSITTLNRPADLDGRNRTSGSSCLWQCGNLMVSSEDCMTDRISPAMMVLITPFGHKQFGMLS